MWTLLAIVTVAWLLWGIVCLVALEADKRQHKRPPNAGFSILPVVPLVPLLFLELAHLLNAAGHSFGIWIVGGFHLFLIIIYSVRIAFEARRMRSAGRLSGPR